MTREVWYRYLGTNGVIDSPVHLEDIYYIRNIHLTASAGKVLTNGKVFQSRVVVPEDEESLWTEIDEKQAKID